MFLFHQWHGLALSSQSWQSETSYHTPVQAAWLLMWEKRRRDRTAGADEQKAVTFLPPQQFIEHRYVCRSNQCSFYNRNLNL